MKSYIIIGFLLVLLIMYFNDLTNSLSFPFQSQNQKETFADINPLNSLNSLSNEAISNIASVYNNDKMNVTNLNVTDTITTKNLNATNTDFKLGAGDTGRGNCGACRAIVKDTNNVLAVNYNNDYNNGTRIDGKLVVGNIMLSKGWSGYPDNKTDGSEISNDVGTYKELMLVGNKSSGGNRRVGVWDNLSVHGDQQIAGILTVGGAQTVGGRLNVQSIKLGDALGDRIIRKRTDVNLCPNEDIANYSNLKNLDECIDKCISGHAEAMSCTYGKNGSNKGICFCKRGVNNAKYDTQYDSAIII